MNVQTYNPGVRVGNWNEDIQLEEDILKDFLDKKDKGELLIQKSHSLKAIMSKKIELSVSQDFAVHIGDLVMIKCLADKDQTKYFAGVEPRKDCVIALNVNPEALLQRQVTGLASATACKDLSSNQRTVFCIEGVEDCPKGIKLKYGQPFYLHTIGENVGKHYLWSDVVTFNKCAKKSGHQQVCLVEEPTKLCHWIVQHKNPLLRLEYDHCPVEANEEVIILHRMTNRCLAVEKFNIWTPFGPEYELSTHTYLDSHKAEMDNNRWLLVCGVPGSSVYPVPEQGPAPAPIHPVDN